MNTMVPAFFPKILYCATTIRGKPRKEDDLVVLEPKMFELLKSFKRRRCGTKKGGLNLLKNSSKKRKLAKFNDPFELATKLRKNSRLRMSLMFSQV